MESTASILKVTLLAPILIITSGCHTHHSASQRSHLLSSYSTLHSFVRTDPKPLKAVSDSDILNYAESLSEILFLKSRGADITRSTSDSFQQTLAAIAGSASVLGIANAEAPIIAFSSAMIPVYQQIFDARGKSKAFHQAYAKVNKSKSDYLIENLYPRNNALTTNGVILSTRIEAIMSE